jgi:chromodomain-helicase-DNA-binding protein 6
VDAVAQDTADKTKSMFATATFGGTEGDGADGIALDDPDFWLKLMPEAAAAAEKQAHW